MPLPVIPVNSWVEVANSKLSTVQISRTPPSNSQNGIFAESGGAWVDHLESYVHFGGGHADYCGNELMGFSIATMAWTVIDAGTSTASIDNIAGNFERYTLDTSRPSSRHTRGGVQYLPERDSLLSQGGSLWKNGGNSRQTWEYDFGLSDWTLRTAAPDGRFTNVFSAYDPTTATVLLMRPDSVGGVDRLYRFTPGSPGTWTLLSTIPDHVIGFRRTMAFDHSRQRVFIIGQGELWMFDLLVTPVVAQEVTVTGTTTPIFGNAPGCEYDPDLDRLVVWRHGSQIWLIHPETFIATALDPSGDTPPSSQGGGYDGPGGRFRRIRNTDGTNTGYYIAVNFPTQNVYLYRAIDIAPPQEPPDPPDPVGPISRQLLTSGDSTTNSTTHSTATMSPAANRVLLVFHMAGDDSTAPEVPTISGLGLTWTQVNTVSFHEVASSNRKRLTAWTASTGDTAPTAGSVTFTYAATLETAAWFVEELTNVDTDTPVVQSDTATTTTSLTISPTLANFEDATNCVVYLAAGHDSDGQAFTADGSLTILGQETQTFTSMRMALAFQEGEDLTPSMTITGGLRSMGAIAIELRPAPETPVSVTLADPTAVAVSVEVDEVIDASATISFQDTFYEEDPGFTQWRVSLMRRVGDGAQVQESVFVPHESSGPLRFSNLTAGTYFVRTEQSNFDGSDVGAGADSNDFVIVTISQPTTMVVVALQREEE